MTTKLLLTVGISFVLYSSFAQGYDSLISNARKLQANTQYKEAAITFTKAFLSNGNRGTLDDRYDGARAWAQAGVPDSAFYQLFRIAERGNFSELKRLTTEKDFIPLHSHTDWIRLTTLISENKKRLEANYIQPIASQLEAIYDADQQYRIKIDSVQRIYGWESTQVKELFKKMALTDSVNLLKVSQILNTHGWLGPDKVGYKGNACLFLVIQHADLATQKKYYPMLKEAALGGDAELSSMAMMEDRIAVRENKKQKYGTQILKDKTTGDWIVAPLEDPKKVDEFRAQVGLGPLAEYLKHWGIKWP
jgi:hypothetical protein